MVSFDFPRLTINGWFHGPVESEGKDDDDKFSSDKTVLSKPNDEIVEADLKHWISPIYLSPKCKSQILEKFQDTSEISLESYFLETKYDAIVDILQNNGVYVMKYSISDSSLFNFYCKFDRFRMDATRSGQS